MVACLPARRTPWERRSAAGSACQPHQALPTLHGTSVSHTGVAQERSLGVRVHRGLVGLFAETATADDGPGMNTCRLGPPRSRWRSLLHAPKDSIIAKRHNTVINCTHGVGVCYIATLLPASHRDCTPARGGADAVDHVAMTAAVIVLATSRWPAAIDYSLMADIRSSSLCAGVPATDPAAGTTDARPPAVAATDMSSTCAACCRNSGLSIANRWRHSDCAAFKLDKDTAARPGL